MSFTIHDRTPQVTAKIGQQTSLGLRLWSEAVVKTATPRTPKDTGDLRNRVLKQVLGGKGKIVWQVPYAKFQERGFGRGPIRNYTTGGTGAHFAENTVKELAPTLIRFIKRGE